MNKLLFILLLATFSFPVFSQGLKFNPVGVSSIDPTGTACTSASRPVVYGTGTSRRIYQCVSGVYAITGTGSGTVTSASVTTANGVSATVATATTTPAFTFTLGAITPSSIASSGAISGTTGTFSGLTSGRVPYASTGGLLIDNANLTFNGATLIASGFLATGDISLNNDRPLYWYDSGSTARRMMLLSPANNFYVGAIDAGWTNAMYLGSSTSTYFINPGVGVTASVNNVTGRGTFTGIALTNLALSSTAPTVTSAGTSPSIPSNNGTAAFTVNVGTGGTAHTIVLALPTATTGWLCEATNRTGNLANRADQAVRQTATTTTSATLQSQTVSTGAALAFTASDIVQCKCIAY